MNNYTPQPGYYNPYTYMNPVPTIPTQFSQPQYSQNYSMAQNIQPQQPTVLNGKFVDNEEILKVTEIPMGGYGIFPKADFSAIYFKYWTKEGKTDIMKFAPVQVEAQQSEQDVAIQKIIDKIDSLETKLNSLLTRESAPMPIPAPIQKVEPQFQQQQQPQFETKEVKMNEY